MPIAPADKALTDFERAQITTHVDEMKKFATLPEPKKLQVIKALAGDAFRLFAEVLRLEAELQLTVDRLERVRADNTKLEEQGFALIVERDNLVKMVADKDVAIRCQGVRELSLNERRIQAVEALETAVGAGVRFRTALEKIRDARSSGCSTGESMSKVECWAREALEPPPPVPMCRDPLGEVFPPSRSSDDGSGSPT